ncbi:MAG: protein phosphatase 2C domain-containing protein, partial [Synechococcus sp.]
MKPAPLAPAWSAPLHRSRQGSSHRRRGTPCQDASIGVTLRAADGVPVTLMAVADGHGGQRYWLSDVGSRLACQVAIDLAGRDLARRRLAAALEPAEMAQLKQWLAIELPERIVQGWQAAVAADWEQRQR